MYESTTGSDKTALLDGSTVAVTGASAEDINDDNIIDTRLRTADNITITLASHTPATSTAYNLVCPGNEAGDGTCVSLAFKNRGLRATDGGFAVGTAAVSVGLAHVGSSVYVHTYDNATVDNMSSIRMTFARDSATTTDNSTMAMDNGTGATNPHGAVVMLGSDAYVATIQDNTTHNNIVVSKQTSAAGSWATYDTTITTSATGTDNTTAYELAVGGSALYLAFDDATTSTNLEVYKVATGKLASVTKVGTGYCFGASDGFGIVLLDNSTGTTYNVTKVLDNTTASVAGTISVSGTGTAACAIVENSGTFYAAVEEDASADNVSVWSSTDLATWTQKGTAYAVTAALTDLSITVDTNGLPIVASRDGTAGVNIEIRRYEDTNGDGTSTWTSLVSTANGASGSGKIVIAAGDSGKFVYAADNSTGSSVQSYFPE
jgi:hypothetical protein